MKKVLLLLLLLKQFTVTAQNVGIGTTNPLKAKLEVHGAVDATSAIFGGESSGVSIQRNWPGIGFNTYYGNGAHRYLANGHGGLLSLDPANGFLVVDMFGHGGANLNINFPNRAMVISKEGWVGIGSAQAPTASLRVARGVGFDGTAMLEGSSHTSYFNKGTDEHTYIRAGKAGGIVHINEGVGGKVNLYGKVGVNTTATDFPLEIGQSLFEKGLQFKILGATWGMGVDNTGGLRFFSNGNLIGQFLSSTGAYQSLSDKRLKTNIHSLPDVLPKLMQLTPVDYLMAGAKPSNKKTIGFLAQDVKELFPELVTVIRDTTHGYKNISDLHTLDYSGFGVLAVKAIQEQQQLIRELQEQLNLLKQTVDALQKKASGSGVAVQSSK
jgi:hypothetical protein